MWPLLGRFSGFMCIGSLAGAVAWGTIMQSNDLYYDAEVPTSSCQQFDSLHASANRYLAVFFVTYGLEFICLIIPKLFLLDRLTNDAMRSSKVRTSGPDALDALDALDGVPTSRCACLLPFFYRTVSIVARFLSAVGLIAKVAGAVFEFQSADEFDHAASSCNSSGAHRNATSLLVDQANLAAAIQSSSEAVTLLITSLAFCILVPLSVASFRRAESVAAHALLSADHDRVDRKTQRARTVVEDTMGAVAEQRQRLVTACLVVLVTFVTRAAYDVFRVYGTYYSRANPACGKCDTCQSDEYLITTWRNFTPELQPIVVALSSPLPLVLSLRLITRAHARARSLAVSLQNMV